MSGWEECSAKVEIVQTESTRRSWEYETHTTEVRLILRTRHSLTKAHQRKGMERKERQFEPEWMEFLFSPKMSSSCPASKA